MSVWIDEELETVEFKDKRTAVRMGKILKRFYESPDKSIKAAGRGWDESKASYRFFSKPDVTLEKIMRPHRDATLKRVREQPIVLNVQDTSELDYTLKKGLEGTGPLSTKSRQGFFAHNQLLITPERLPLGVWKTEIKARAEEEHGKAADRKKKPIEQKESFRWLEGYREACRLQAEAPETVVISCGDREYDIYEIFEERLLRLARGEAAAELLIRSKSDRLLNQEGEESEGTGEGAMPARKLRARIGAEPVLGVLPLKVKGKTQYKKNKARSTIKVIRKAREAELELRAGTVTLAPPHRLDRKLSAMTINVVMATERNPPADEEPIEWVLLTTLEVKGFEDAKRIVEWYAVRWEIEVFHKIVKTGCKVEELQLKAADRVQCAIGLYMIVAWRVMYVMKLGRECPDLPCDVIFDEDEWQSLWRLLHGEEALKEVPSLNAFVTEVARLGGFLARRGDGPPGPLAIWVGLSRVRDYALAWQIFVKKEPPLRQRRIE